MKPYKVLIIEDDLNAAENICKFLSDWVFNAPICKTSSRLWPVMFGSTRKLYCWM